MNVQLTGHCYCKECIPKIKVNHNLKNYKWKAECPQCRAGIKDKDGISLFFHFPDSLDATQSQISRSADLIEGIDPRSNVEDVTRVGEYLENVVNDVVEKKARLTDENVKVSNMNTGNPSIYS